MKRIFLDTNVILDVLLEREPWVNEGKEIWQAHDEGQITGFLSAASLTDIFYFSRKIHGLSKAQAAIQTCLSTFEICAVDRFVLEQALSLRGSDFEDNVQIACATIAQLDAIITRDKAGFKETVIPVYTPAEFVALLA